MSHHQQLNGEIKLTPVYGPSYLKAEYIHSCRNSFRGSKIWLSVFGFKGFQRWLYQRLPTVALLPLRFACTFSILPDSSIWSGNLNKFLQYAKATWEDDILRGRGLTRPDTPVSLPNNSDPYLSVSYWHRKLRISQRPLLVVSVCKQNGFEKLSMPEPELRKLNVELTFDDSLSSLIAYHLEVRFSAALPWRCSYILTQNFHI